MCTNHGKLFGSEAVVESEAIARRLVEACSARLQYVEQQADAYKAWLGSQQDIDMEAKLASIVLWAFDFDKGSNSQEKDENKESYDNWFESEFEGAKALEGMYHNNAIRAQAKYYSIEQRLQRTLGYWASQQEYAGKRIEALRAELALSDRIQDGIDKMPNNKASAMKYKERLSMLLENKEISWNTFQIMANQIHDKMKWKKIVSKYPSHCVADTVEYWERAIEWSKAAQRVANEMAIEMTPVVSGEELDIDNECGEFKSAQLFGQLTWGFSARSKG
jgi:hypothetical protein